MHDRDLYQTILGLTEPWTVVDVDVDAAAEEVTVEVELRSGTKLTCPECGGRSDVHDHRQRKWRHLDTCQYKTILSAKIPRVECGEHGVKQVSVPWAEDRARFTALFEKLAIDWLKAASISAVADRLRLSWDEAAGIQARAVRRGLVRRKRKKIRFLGVDEKSFQKRHDYVSVLCDLRERTVLDVADDRTQESLESMLSKLTPKQKRGVEAIAMDMWDPYIRAVDAQIPMGREKIVFDKFHIAKHLNEAVDQVRRQEAKELRKAGDETLTGTRYLWLKHPDNFSREQWRGFKELREGNLKVARAWAIKETAMNLWDYVYQGSARRFFKGWFGWARRSRLKPIMAKAKMMKARLDNILTYLKHRITNAVAEGINAKIQWIKYMARGYRNRESFKNAILFHCGNLDLYPHTKV